MFGTQQISSRFTILATIAFRYVVAVMCICEFERSNHPFTCSLPLTRTHMAHSALKYRYETAVSYAITDIFFVF